MVRNLSFKTDDEFDDKLYSVSKKKGLTKSAFIRNEIEKVVKKEFESGSEEKHEMKDQDDKKTPIYKPFNIEQNQGAVKAEPNLREPIITQSSVTEVKQLEEKEIVKLEDKKPEIKIPDIKINVSPEIKKEQNSIKKVNNMSSELPQDSEKVYRKLREQEKFNESFSDLHRKVNSLCEDGKCLKDELTNIRKDVIDIKSIKENLVNLPELKKQIEDLKKEYPQVEMCPDCGQKSILHLGSYCSNCGTEIKEWSDEKGNKLEGWKPYKLRK